MNSIGKDEAERNFRAWFGHSSVVDANGAPLVVYHGTPRDFTEFKEEFQTAGDLGKGFYFTDSKKLASDWARNGVVIPVYLSGRTGLDMLKAGLRPRDGNLVICEWRGARMFKVVHPQQIKSIFNSGKWDPESSSLTDPPSMQTKHSRHEPTAFQKWFGASKIVDRRGRPLVVYHRTNRDFDAFDTNRGDLGAHFGSAAQAEAHLNGSIREGDRTLAVYLRLENPLRLTDKGGFHADAVAPQLKRLGLIDPATAARLAKAGDRGTLTERREANREIKSLLGKAGYDGIVYKNQHEGKGDSYIAFDPGQIKSAIGNTGAFDRESDSLTDGEPEDQPRPPAPRG